MMTPELEKAYVKAHRALWIGTVANLVIYGLNLWHPIRAGAGLWICGYMLFFVYVQFGLWIWHMRSRSNHDRRMRILDEEIVAMRMRFMKEQLDHGNTVTLEYTVHSVH